MKKFVLSLMLIITVVSCKKETEKKYDITEKDTIQSVVEKDNAVVPDDFNLKEFTSQQATDILSKKDNDTLYVTNFFATWCGPCMKEIPHFKEKLIELKDKPVKFTFISLDSKTDWATDVKNFAEENGLEKHIVLLDGNLLDEKFFVSNFKTWKGESIPFTFMRKGDKTDETVGMMSKEDLNTKINSFK